MGQDPFHTTMWSRIEEVQRGDSLAVWSFVDRYRPSLVRFIQGKGFSAQDAEDLAQEVLMRLFAKDALLRADRERGRFRAFLVGITKNVMRKDRERKAAKKRGGGAKPVPLDEVPEVAAESASDEAFDRIWAEQLLSRAFDTLKAENPRQYQTLIFRFQEDMKAEAIAEHMGRNVQQVRNDLHRARKRLARIVRDEIMRYASSREEFDEELALFRTLVGLGE